MSDEIPQPGAESAPTEAPEAPAVEEASETKTFDESYVKKLREEAAGYRTRLKEFEDAQKTEAQKAAERLAELESKVNQYETREQVAGWKADVAKATGVPIEALAGSTLEEITAHGETLKSLMKPGGPVVPDAGKTPPPQPVDEKRAFLRDLLDK